MIRFAHGNLLGANVDALVNAVNTAGVMGKGIALMFKGAISRKIQGLRRRLQKRKALTVGRMFVTELQDPSRPHWIINFPTKAHWRNPSKIEWIEAGLQDLKRVIEEKKIKSIAIPALGSGNGGLNWCDVRPLIESSMGNLPDVDVVIYEPRASTKS